MTDWPDSSPRPVSRWRSDPFAAPTAVARALTGAVVARRAAFTDAGPSDSDGLLSLAEEVLTAREHSVWRALPSSTRRRSEWLLGRVAAKDVVRSLVLSAREVLLDPLDVEIVAGPTGAPRVVGARDSARVDGIRLSIAHSAGVALALGTLDGSVRGVGIDVEPCTVRRSLERKALSPSERAALDACSPELRTELILRCWCAKEAAAKALGTGLHPLGGAQAVAVTPHSADFSVLSVETRPPDGLPPRSLLAATRRDGDLIIAAVIDLGL